MIGLIVDGDGDYAAFSAKFKGVAKVLKTGGPRGHLVSCRNLVSSARKEISQLRSFGCTPIAVVTDLEGRQEACLDFCAALAKEASALGVPEDVNFFAADKMFENWILADIHYLAPRKIYLRPQARQKQYESTDGKVELKKLFKKGYDYNEVKHCAELFLLVRIASAVKRSSSLSRFVESTGLA